MSLFGVQLNSQINRLITQIRLQLNQQKFIPNTRTIYRSFATYDPTVSGQITPQKFEKALGQNGLFFKEFQIQIFYKAFGNGQGKIQWFPFLSLVKQPMNQTRRDLISNIFEYITSQLQDLTPENITKQFNPDNIELYKTGKVTKQYLQQQLISLLSIPEGKLTKEELLAFYDDLSVNFPHDEPFLKYVSQQWNYSPNNTPTVSEQYLREIIKALRHKLIQKTNGTNDEFLLKKLFTGFDENKNGYISAFELDLMLKRLQLPIREAALQPLFHKLDKNDSGFIEYDQFKHFLFFDPFPA